MKNYSFADFIKNAMFNVKESARSDYHDPNDLADRFKYQFTNLLYDHADNEEKVKELFNDEGIFGVFDNVARDAIEDKLEELMHEMIILKAHGKIFDFEKEFKEY